MKTKTKRGRPFGSGNELKDRLLIRIDSDIRNALREYGTIRKIGADSTAARLIIAEKLTSEGLLK